MNRIFCVLVLALSPCLCHAAQQFELKGQITNGASLTSPAVGDTLPVPQPSPLEFPIPYTALLTYEPENGAARFQFSHDFAGVPLEHFVGGVVEGSFAGNLFGGIQQFDTTAVLIDFLSSPGTFMTSFDLALNRTTGQGSWNWFEFCPVCFGFFPAAEATITSYRLVPEPGTALLILSLAVLLGPVRLRRRCAV